MPRRLFFILALVLLAAAAARAQGPGGCKSETPSDPAFFADMKPVPGGKWGMAYRFDRAQFDDKTSPVVVRGLVGVTGRQVRGGKFSCADLENRTGRAVRAVELRWFVTADEDETKVLARGRLPVVEAALAPAGRLGVGLRDAHFADFMQPLAKDGELKGSYTVHLGVSKVEFADGTAAELPDAP